MVIGEFVTYYHHYSYTYDSDGNITTISLNGSLQQTFTYNSSNELVRVDDAVINKTVTYDYDYVGNVTSVKTYIYTTGTLGTPLTTQNYTYNSQNQRTDLSYDANGNMTSLNGYTFGWTNRRLTSATSTDNSISYTYNYDGIRTSKTINGITTYYVVDENNNVVKQYELVNDVETNVIEFVYDSNNSPIYFIYNNTTYYYEKNLQGDIVAILDANGNIVVEYTYDIWGKLLGITGELADTLGVANPLRYRGYYYDAETGLYYLQSRYYSPDLMKFISQDDPALSNDQGEPLGSNLYVYCLNNPINRSDENGYFSASEFWQYVNSLPIVKGATRFAGFAWDNQQGIWYSLMNPIQRKLGYCDLYDTLAPLAGIFISHKKMPFTYNGKSWIIWIWKGQYGITTGAEIGLYVCPKTLSATVLGKRYSQKWYRCANDSERINMSFTLYKNGKKMFSRGYQTHWWLTGFKPGIKLWWENLSMYITLGFKNLTMAKSFCSANGLSKPSSSKVSFWW